MSTFVDPLRSPPLLVCCRKTTYEILCVISQGSFGIVYKARNRKTGEIVAVKQELTGMSPSTQREIDILSSLPHHPSIVELKDLTIDNQRRVFVVMEYMEEDMKKMMESRPPFVLIYVKFLMKRLLEGVALMHDNGIMHRDLKPSNILIDSTGGMLKICDFGLSRGFNPSGRYTPRVGTLWYRAPEVLLGVDQYSCAVDMWSVGCIMAELLLNKVLFKGNSEFGQLLEIYTVLGRPNDVTCPGFSSLPESGFFLQMDENDSMLRMKFAQVRMQVTEHGFDLLERFFNYDPKKRITARDALNHRWFREF